MKEQKVTISEIAKVLKVSAISVSRALSGRPGVSEKLREKILNTADQMGYIKNRTYNILVLHKKPYIQDNSNFSCMVQGIEKALQDSDVEYSIEFIDKENQEKLYMPNKLSKGNSFDGVIFMGRFIDSYVEFIRKKINHQVFYTGYSPSFDYDSVWFNFNNNGYKQCEYLIKKGHKRIGFLGNTSIYKNREKVLGITMALEDYDIPIESRLILDIQSDFEEAVLDLIKQKALPTAFICQWDYTAIKLIKFLYENGYKVPDDVSIIGSGNTEMSSLTIPALTTIDLNIEYSCKAAVELLLKSINSPEKPFETILINSALVERDSVREVNEWAKK